MQVRAFEIYILLIVSFNSDLQWIDLSKDRSLLSVFVEEIWLLQSVSLYRYWIYFQWVLSPREWNCMDSLVINPMKFEPLHEISNNLLFWQM